MIYCSDVAIINKQVQIIRISIKIYKQDKLKQEKLKIIMKL